MNLIHVIILSIIEGFTEFLPISSTGHLILATKVFGVQATDFQKTFEIVIQLGAILAVVAIYIRRLLTDLNLIKRLLVAFIPTAVVGFFAYPLIKGVLLGSSVVTLVALFAGGVVLILIEMFFKQQNKNIPAGVSYKQALIIGSFQSISIVPGVSRAAATIVGGLTVGLSRSEATEFSFLLAVPTMVAATALDLFKSRNLFSSADFVQLGLGTLFSFFFALIAVRFLINFVKKHNFTVFGIYRIILALLFWLLIK